MGPGNVSNLGIVGRNDDAVETARQAGRLNRPSDHWLAAEGLDVLTRDALAAPPSRNDREPHCAIASRKDVTTRSCSDSVKVGCIGMLIASR